MNELQEKLRRRRELNGETSPGKVELAAAVKEETESSSSCSSSSDDEDLDAALEDEEELDHLAEQEDEEVEEAEGKLVVLPIEQDTRIIILDEKRIRISSTVEGNVVAVNGEKLTEKESIFEVLKGSKLDNITLKLENSEEMKYYDNDKDNVDVSEGKELVYINVKDKAPLGITVAALREGDKCNGMKVLSLKKTTGADNKENEVCLFKEGDIIVSVNGKSLIKLSARTATTLLRNFKDRSITVIRRLPDSTNSTRKNQNLNLEPLNKRIKTEDSADPENEIYRDWKAIKGKLVYRILEERPLYAAGNAVRVDYAHIGVTELTAGIIDPNRSSREGGSVFGLETSPYLDTFRNMKKRSVQTTFK